MFSGTTTFIASLALGLSLGCSQGPDTPRSESETSAKTQSSGDVKTNKKSKCAKLVGGNDTDDFKPVVLLARANGDGSASFCSATVIGSNTILTAGHCVSPSDPENVRYIGNRATRNTIRNIFKKGIAPKKVIHHGTQYLGDNLEVSSSEARDRDVAILIFAKDLGLEIMEMSGKRPAYGEEVDLVGFGSNIFADSEESHTFRRQTGKNTVEDFRDLGRDSLGISGAQNTQDSDNVLVSFGDSGGAMIHKGKLVGVTSTISPTSATRGAGFFADLARQHNQKLFEEAEDAGAKIGLPDIKVDSDEKEFDISPREKSTPDDSAAMDCA
jgi:hypothetical protein